MHDNHRPGVQRCCGAVPPLPQPPALLTEAHGLVENAPSKGGPLTCSHRRGRGRLGWQKQHRPLVHPRLLPECLSRLFFLPLSLKRKNSPTPSHHLCSTFISQTLTLWISVVSLVPLTLAGHHCSSWGWGASPRDAVGQGQHCPGSSLQM